MDKKKLARFANMTGTILFLHYLRKWGVTDYKLAIAFIWAVAIYGLSAYENS